MAVNPQSQHPDPHLEFLRPLTPPNPAVHARAFAALLQALTAKENEGE